MVMQTVFPDDIRLLEFSGPDARAYLQSQLATDLRALLAGACKHAALLAANGRVLAAGTLHVADEQRFQWLLHKSLFPDLIPHLKRYLLRSKLTITVRDDLRLSASETANSLYRFEDAASRHLALAAPEHLVAVDGTRYAAQAIAAGILDFAQSHADRHLPQAIGLQHTGAIALDKGCYPGQEIVARSHYLGRVKRGLARYRCDASPTEPALTDSNDQEIGELLNCLSVAGQTIGLATLQLSAQAAWAQSDSPERISVQLEFLN